MSKPSDDTKTHTGKPAFDLAFAIALAKEAHKEQKDKGDGAPYVTHCLRVMEALEPYGKDAQIVGALHDSIEDTWVTPKYLREAGASEVIIEAILSVTKRDGEAYENLVKRAKANPIGKIVKLADNLDNSNEQRLVKFTPEESARFRQKYEGARQILLEKDDWLAAQLPSLKAKIESLHAAPRLEN